VESLSPRHSGLPDSIAISNQSDEVADGAMRFNRVPQRELIQDSVMIPSPYLFTLDEAVLFEVSDDSLDRSLLNANL